jgi:hypothetical protein
VEVNLLHCDLAKSLGQVTFNFIAFGALHLPEDACRKSLEFLQSKEFVIFPFKVEEYF